MNITCLFRTWPYSCIWLRNTFTQTQSVYHYHQVAQLAQISLILSLSIYIYIYPYHPLLTPDLLNYILCPHRTVVGKFLMVDQHWHVHVKGSMGEVTYELVVASPAVSACSTYLDGKWLHSSCFMGYTFL